MFRRLTLVAAATILAGGLAHAADGGARTDGDETETAIFAGGCFWCVEADFDALDGVLETISGYTGGTVGSPTYRQVVEGGTGHREAVKVVYDPDTVDYETLVDAFFRSVDPTDGGGQFCDRGFSYSTAIYATGGEQAGIAKRARAAAADELGQEIATPIEMAGAFWPAEDYHQNYYEESTLKYDFYRWNCGRDARVEALWGQTAKEYFATLNEREAPPS